MTILARPAGCVNPCGRAAPAYAQRFAWHVLPLHSVRGGRCTCGKLDCPSAGKHPLTTHGVTDATVDLAMIAGWWRRWPSANVGIATGQISGFLVLDVDGEPGKDSLRTLEDQHGPLPSTVEAITGSDGRHILFAYPGHPIGNRVKFAPGLNTRADGGYIVAAPSPHKSGRQYCWEVSSRPGEVPLAPCPAWLLDMLGGSGPATGRAPEDWRRLGHGGVDEGERNATIAKLAGLLLRRYVDPYLTLDMLFAWNAVRCRPPLPDDEVARTVGSVARAEARRREGAARG